MAMTTVHAAVGMAIVTIIPNPWISIPLAFLSHTLVDLYPEWYDQDKKYDSKEVAMGIIEILLMVFIGYVLFHEKSWVLWAGAVAANLIDLWDAIYVIVTSKGKNILNGKCFWFCHPGGWFPFKVSTWQGFGMRALQTATLDFIFVVIILMLILKLN
jgi:hypothetical protein